MLPAGYSGTPLAKKLGIKDGFMIKTINAPEHYLNFFDDLPANIRFSKSGRKNIDLIHCFVTEKTELFKLLPLLKKQIKPEGIIWISWPKKTSGVSTDVSEKDIRDTALQIGLVDVKVCAVNETWSGLKLVIPVKDRKKSK